MRDYNLDNMRVAKKVGKEELEYLEKSILERIW